MSSRANSRNRAYIIAEVAQALGIPLQLTPDLNSPERGLLAHAVVETLHHDLYQAHDTSTVCVLNYVAETGCANNGVACTLAPWHGVLIFHGQVPAAIFSAYLPLELKLSCGDIGHERCGCRFRAGVRLPVRTDRDAAPVAAVAAQDGHRDATQARLRERGSVRAKVTQ